MGNVIRVLVSVVISALSIPLFRGNVSILHRYHYKNVQVQDIPAYGKLTGISLLIIGLSMLAKSVLKMMLKTDSYSWVSVAGLIVGTVIFVIAQYKYNGGLF